MQKNEIKSIVAITGMSFMLLGVVLSVIALVMGLADIPDTSWNGLFVGLGMALAGSFLTIAGGVKPAIKNKRRK